jgi:ParB family transcriptional regulator, chromosome partitioning protein
MAKSTDMMSRFGGNVAESIGANRQGGGGPAVVAPPSRNVGVDRLRAGAQIEVDRIIADPNQPRSEFDEDGLDRLAASLREHGQIQPISVRWSEAHDRYIVVAGERRWRASIQAGRKSIDAVILDGSRDESEILELQLIENCLREDLRPVEQAKAFRTLMDRNGWTGEQLAEKLHISNPSVFRSLALLKLPTPVQEQVEAGKLAPSVAYEVSRIEDATEQAEVAKRVIVEGLSRDQTVEVVRQSKARKPAEKGRGATKVKPRKTTERAFRTEAGPKVTVEFKRGLDGPTALAAILEVADRLRAELGDDEVAA